MREQHPRDTNLKLHPSGTGVLPYLRYNQNSFAITKSGTTKPDRTLTALVPSVSPTTSITLSLNSTGMILLDLTVKGSVGYK